MTDLSLGGTSGLSRGFGVQFVDPDAVELIPGANEGFEAYRYTRPDGRVVAGLLHEYERIYTEPGLYETLLLAKLGYSSHIALAHLLATDVNASGMSMADLRVLDVGAGNGLGAEQLRLGGTPNFAGADLSPAAKLAAHRDRPGLYDLGYEVGDLGQRLDRVADLVKRNGLNCLISVGAIGGGHVPLDAFDEMWKQFPPGSFIALTVSPKVSESGVIEDVLAETTTSLTRSRAFHRRSMAGGRLHYDVLIGRRADS